ncbi:hypothetical protein TrispH2_008867 [Trichoplax sp. H2]|nr:hypothetical protein TrispH2_008867 [Trichoplax sp. H2]|eukprot:RDD39994.1 hypothetical protein TrispH2_008867 [Trichoplax sp. H2]
MAVENQAISLFLCNSHWISQWIFLVGMDDDSIDIMSNKLENILRYCLIMFASICVHWLVVPAWTTLYNMDESSHPWRRQIALCNHLDRWLYSYLGSWASVSSIDWSRRWLWQEKIDWMFIFLLLQSMLIIVEDDEESGSSPRLFFLIVIGKDH